MLYSYIPLPIVPRIWSHGFVHFCSGRGKLKMHIGEHFDSNLSNVSQNVLINNNQ